ncbi:penicillin-insensitive murein endopeptidase [Chelatococcus asaccharovorans]|uniref:penicillin-insensitive murein endopeptidase n=1 Tax=Chelatococcus asaccharovorans TaxID=28210 RepID=UPI00224C6CF7|nr:penicillin-insensitive murein endopeptidase [Chelatococcus asaccharovorans]CAH1650965.1 Penicillin-insensitive murein endopeptidase [Chelatococcus asaccharovorans]CAH1686689.1 Penicillin-insensitive murein endopeptidase [Chelatococcus asaccharovorans]
MTTTPFQPKGSQGAGRAFKPLALAGLLIVLTSLIGGHPARAQENAAQEAARRKAALAKLPADAAQRRFGTIPLPSAGQAAVFGFYSLGCLAGGVMLPPDGPTWQVMRLSRNRNWGHPALVEFLQNFAAKVPSTTGWPGILVGDMGQPRGGPMLTGHASHQIGLDADIWLTAMPAGRLSANDREEVSAINMVRSDWNDIDPSRWTASHMALLKTAASFRQVERVLVNPAIKRALCRDAGSDRRWLSKIRPAPGHNYHFHIRLACPAGETACRRQAPPPTNDGCGAELDWWFSAEARRPKPHKPAPPLMVADLPAQCRAVIDSAAAAAKN